MKSYDLVVLGAGAAGLFAAISAREACAHAKILVIESSSKMLTKVGLSGGGRCNVTNACFDLKDVFVLSLLTVVIDN